MFIAPSEIVCLLVMKPLTELEETLAQVFSCEFCKVSKNSVSYRTPPVAASHLLIFLERFFWLFY